MPKIAIVHTSFALVKPLNDLIKKEILEAGIINIVDDTLLHYARANGVDHFLVKRMCSYFDLAAEGGADVILNACSTVGESVNVARKLIHVPILKIDEPMAEEAVRVGGRIAILATLESTIAPTANLLKETAASEGKEIQLTCKFSEGVFDLLYAGKVDEHDRIVKDVVNEVAGEHDVIVFAQASMAQLAEKIGGEISIPLLSSPSFAIKRLKTMLSQLQ